MVVTAKEAKEKWCPFARVADSEYQGYNREEGSSWPKCIADRCMAWRWVDKGRELGYCGLAGPPFLVWEDIAEALNDAIKNEFYHPIEELREIAEALEGGGR